MADSITMTGASGRSYTFTAYPFGTQWNSAGAVYAVLNGRVLYVGQTGDMKTRFADHHHEYGFALHRASHVAVYGEGSEDRRRAIESDLVAYYNPPLNQTNHG